MPISGSSLFMFSCLAGSCIALIAAGLLSRLNRGLGYEHYKHWVISWYLFALSLGLSALSVVMGTADYANLALSMLIQGSEYLRNYFLLIGVFVMGQLIRPGLVLHLIVLAVIVLMTLILNLAFAGLIQTVFVALFASITAIFCALMIYKHASFGLMAVLFATCLLVFGLLQSLYAFDSLGFVALNGWLDGVAIFNVLLQAGMAFSLVAWAIDEGNKKLADNEIKLSKIALYDHLTGLLNRRGLDEQFSYKVKDASAFVFFDLDRFKKVNDTYGHETGDWLLVAVSRLLQAASGPSDLTCRLGGDEFIWVINAAEGKSATIRKIHQFRESVANLNMVDGESVSVSCSIGVSWFPDNSEDLGELTRQSDQALYEAKERGKNRIVNYS